MAGIKVAGIDELIAKATHLSAEIRDQAISRALLEAAAVYNNALRTAAPVGTDASNKSKKRPAHGELRGSIKIFKGKDKRLFSGGRVFQTSRILVGPEKVHGFYGYFLEHGWKAPLGGKMTYWAKPGRWWSEGKWVTTGRRLRAQATPTTHTQMGLTRYRQIHIPKYEDWSAKAIRGAEDTALVKALAVFENVLRSYR